MSQPARKSEPPRRETPIEHVYSVRRDVAEGRLTAQQLIRMANKALPPAGASRALTNVLRPELVGW